MMYNSPKNVLDATAGKRLVTTLSDQLMDVIDLLVELLHRIRKASVADAGTAPTTSLN